MFKVAWSRPPCLDAEDYELQVARAKQIHTCEICWCLVPDYSGHLKCKRQAPFKISKEDKIDKTGNWSPKYLFGFTNGWVSSIAICVHCNNDGKLLTRGADTKNISFYITMYAVKKQGKNHNMSVIFTKGFTYHSKHTSYVASLKDQQYLLLFHLIHMINQEQELAAPMVILYLMGCGDTYIFHHYTPIYWSSFVSVLLQAHSNLSQSNISQHNEVGGSNTNEKSNEDRENKYVWLSGVCIHLFNIPFSISKGGAALDTNQANANLDKAEVSLRFIFMQIDIYATSTGSQWVYHAKHWSQWPLVQQMSGYKLYALRQWARRS